MAAKGSIIRTYNFSKIAYNTLLVIPVRREVAVLSYHRSAAQ